MTWKVSIFRYKYIDGFEAVANIGFLFVSFICLRVTILAILTLSILREDP